MKKGSIFKRFLVFSMMITLLFSTMTVFAKDGNAYDNLVNIVVSEAGGSGYSISVNDSTGQKYNSKLQLIPDKRYQATGGGYYLYSELVNTSAD